MFLCFLFFYVFFIFFLFSLFNNLRLAEKLTDISYTESSLQWEELESSSDSDTD